MSPAEREARQMISDKKAAEAADRAYVRSLRNTEQAPAKATDVNPDMERLSRRIKGLLNPNQAPDVDAMGNQTGMKKGGKVSASSRADGIAQRGKTRGKYL